ncbi:hypothetical protein NPX13_g9521 [Xylaria arbuscula]|uniref:Nucleotide exchange factor SIL1 n=1 Tax=Xylaria arbuscula TaxID=114810 RepID=A0A9W8N689_9PEZI|nr:hypothetical protein NPX13_g9521 [Xylaria arbuscula]
MTTAHLHSLQRIGFTLVLVFTLFCSLISATSPPEASPAAGTELICHTDNPAECYPKLFSATEEFQVVHDDQDLPLGLHVQLDVQTGQKQAKLYNPEEENPALAGLPVDQDVIVVDQPLQDQEPKIRSGAPAYEPAGVVKAPREKNEDFSQALETLKESLHTIKVSGLDEALEILDELSHDLYYGLQIAEDADVVQALLCHLVVAGAPDMSGEGLFMERSSPIASSILSATLGNNPRAIAAIEESWDSITNRRCGAGKTTIKDDLYDLLGPVSDANGDPVELQDAEITGYYLPVIRGLLKSPKIRTEFLKNDGMNAFLHILLRDGDVWEAKRAKVAQIISDTFLDEDFGATLGLWPKKQQIDSGKCDSIDSLSLAEECWAYHLKKISQADGAPDWSKQLLTSIQQAQIPDSPPDAPPKHGEL